MLVLVGLGIVATKLTPTPDTTPPSSQDTFVRLQEVWAAGGGRVIVGAMVTFAVAALGSCLWFLPRAVRGLRALRHRRGLGPPTVGLALALFGMSVVFQGIAVTGYQGPELVLQAEVPDLPPRTRIPRSGGLEVRLQGEAVLLTKVTTKGSAGEVPSEAAPRARLRWAQGAGTIEVAAAVAPPVRLNGEQLESGTTREVWPGDVISVGPLTAQVEGGTWREHLVRACGGGVFAILGVLLLLQVLDYQRRQRADAPQANLLERVGIHRAGVGRELARGAAGYLAFFPLYMLLLWLTQILAQALGLTVESHSLVRALERDAGLAVIVVVQAVVLAPLLEELLYRGIGQPAFERCLGAGGAILATALLFAVMHPGFSSLLPMFGLGVLFASLRLLSPTGSLVAPITAHAMHNGLTLALVLAIQRAGP